MNLSNFIKTYSVPDLPEYTLLFSTRKTSMSLLFTEDFRMLQENKRLPKYEEDLENLGVLVKDPKKEMAKISSFYDELNQHDKSVKVAVVLGMQCNFDCLYCYEGTLKGNKSMSAATADMLIDFIKDRFSNKKQKIHLDFYGGEPLLYVDRIMYLSTALQKFAKDRKSSFDFNIITNGSLLTPKVVKKLTPLGLRYAKVTVDGLAENHDRFRPFKNGAPSFDVIINNIVQVKNLIDIGLGGNFTEYNYEQFPLLLDKLLCKGLGPRQLKRVSFNMVTKVTDEFASASYRGGCASTGEPWLAKATIYIRNEIKKRGYSVPKIRPEPCAVGIVDNFVVNYDGSIYKCLPLIGRKQFRVGTLESGIEPHASSHNLNNWQKEKKCKKCSYLPLCFGGCRYMQYLRTGSMAGVDCQKDYFDMTMEAMLINDLQHAKNREQVAL